MSYSLHKDSATKPLVFFMADSASPLAGKTGLSPTVTLRKSDTSAAGSWGAPAGTVRELASGWYQVDGHATDTDTNGPLLLHATAAGAVACDELYHVGVQPADTLQVNGTAQTAGDLAALIGGIGSGTGAALNFAVTSDNGSAPLNGVTKKGAQTGTYANTLANDASVHSLLSEQDGGVNPWLIQWVYGFNVGSGRTGTKIVFRAAMAAAGDTVTLSAYNFLTTSWDARTTFTGTASQLIDIPLLAGHTGTGADAGKVYLKIDYSENDTGTININEVYCQAQNQGAETYSDGAIWVGGTNTGTTVGVDGVPSNPVTWAAAQTLSTATGLTRFRIRNGFTVTLNAATEGKSLIGRNWTLALGSQSISASYIEGATVTGSATGASPPKFLDCSIGSGTGAVSLPPSNFLRCGFNVPSGNAFSAAAAGNWTLVDCYSQVAGAATPVFTYSGANYINIRRWSGGNNITLDNATSQLSVEVVTGGGQTIAVGGADIEIRGICRSISLTGITSDTTAQIDCVTGPISLTGDNTGGTVNVYGVCGKITQTSMTGATVSSWAGLAGDTFNTATDSQEAIRDKLPANLEDMSITDTTGRVDVGAIAGNTYAVATTSGDWGTNGTWAADSPPSAGQNIIVRTGVTVLVAADLDLSTFGTLTLEGSGAIEIAAGVTVATVPEGWTVAVNGGTVTSNNGTITTTTIGGIVGTNSGTVTYNAGTVSNNGGTVAYNNDTVTTNYGEVTHNNDTVGTNSGIILYGTDGQAMLNTDARLPTLPDTIAVAGEAATAAAGVPAGVWGYTLTAMDALGATTVGKWMRTLFGGITSLANWLRAGFRKSTADATALAEINSGGGTYSATTDSLEAQAETLAAAGDGAYTGTLTVTDGATGLEGATVTAYRGGVLVASGTTDVNGQITDWAFAASTYVLAVRLSGYQSTSETLIVTGNAWTKSVTLSALSITAPAAPSLCTVQFRVKLSDTPVQGAICRAKLQGINQAADGTLLSSEELSDTTDSQGIAELQLVQRGAIVKGGGIYKITVEVGGHPIGCVQRSLPNQSTILFEDLLSS